MGLVSVFCLSWVGAICDAANDPQCLGNNSIHTFCAVAFFVLQDVVMIALAVDPTPVATPALTLRARAVRDAAIALGFTAAGAVHLLSAHGGARGGSLFADDGWTPFENATIIAEVRGTTTGASHEDLSPLHRCEERRHAWSGLSPLQHL